MRILCLLPLVALPMAGDSHDCDLCSNSWGSGDSGPSLQYNSTPVSPVTILKSLFPSHALETSRAYDQVAVPTKSAQETWTFLSLRGFVSRALGTGDATIEGDIHPQSDAYGGENHAQKGRKIEHLAPDPDETGAGDCRRQKETTAEHGHRPLATSDLIALVDSNVGCSAVATQGGGKDQKMNEYPSDDVYGFGERTHSMSLGLEAVSGEDWLFAPVPRLAPDASSRGALMSGMIFAISSSMKQWFAQTLG